MAITNSQQARQMYKEGSGPVVQGGVDNYLGKQPEVQAPRKWQSGPDKPPTELAYITQAEKDLILKENIHGGLEDGPNMGPSGIISLDSFGDIGGGGAGGADTDAGGGARDNARFSGRGPQESPADFKAREAKETARINQLTRQQETRAKEMQKEASKKQGNFFTNFFKARQKGLYNLTPNNPKTELNYIANLKFRNPAAFDQLPQNLKDLYAETEDPANEFSSYKDFDKFSFDDFDSLTSFDPGNTGAMNFADYAATYAGAPGLKFSGNVGNLEKYVTGKDEFGRTMYGYKEKTGDDGPSQATDPCKGPNPPAYCFIGANADENTEAQEENPQAIPYRLMNMGGDTEDAPLMAGAPELKLQGDVQPKQENMMMAEADPFLMDEYEKYVFDMEEMGLQPMTFEEFRREAMSGMAGGGIAGIRQGYFLGGITKSIKKAVKGATRAIKKLVKVN